MYFNIFLYAFNVKVSILTWPQVTYAIMSCTTCTCWYTNQNLKRRNWCVEKSSSVVIANFLSWGNQTTSGDLTLPSIFFCQNVRNECIWRFTEFQLSVLWRWAVTPRKPVGRGRDPPPARNRDKKQEKRPEKAGVWVAKKSSTPHFRSPA